MPINIWAALIGLSGFKKTIIKGNHEAGKERWWWWVREVSEVRI